MGLTKTSMQLAVLQALAADAWIVCPEINLGMALTADFFISWAPDDTNTGYTQFMVEGNALDIGDGEWYQVLYHEFNVPAAISIAGAASTSSGTIADASAAATRININEYAFYKESPISNSEWLCVSKVTANASYSLYVNPSRNHAGPYYNKGSRVRKPANVEALKRLRLLVNSVGRACVFEASLIKSEE